MEGERRVEERGEGPGNLKRQECKDTCAWCSVSAYGFLTSNGQKCWCGKVVGGVCLLMDDLSK